MLSPFELPRNKALDALLGAAIGDAVGFPYDGFTRNMMYANPATDMIRLEEFNFPKGTWTVDSLLWFCLAQALVDDGYNLQAISESFVLWRREAYWTAGGEVTDCGNTTTLAITRLERILAQKKYLELEMQKHEGEANENGNGSLMRILPLLFYIQGKPINEQFRIIWDISALTHTSTFGLR